MDLQKFKDEIIILRAKLEIVAKSMLTNDVDAEDAVQEAYLRLWNNREWLNDHPNVGGYVMQTLKNICIDRLKKNDVNISLDDIRYVDSGITPDVYAEQHDSMRIIRSIIDTLPELQRQVLIMKDIEGYESDEIAEIIGANEAAVRVNLSRARKKIRDKYISISNMKGGINEGV